MAFTGDVIAVTSHWTADDSRIVTEAVVRTPTGDVTVSQLGGTVDELTMRQFPEQQEPLDVGMRVIVDVHDAPDLSGTMHTLVDGVKVLSRAPGFVRTGPTKGNHFLYWESGCVYITTSAEGSRDIPGDQELPVIAASIDEWNTATASCSYLTLIDDGTIEGHDVAKDGINLIKMRDASWCIPSTTDDPPRCHAMSAAGLTTAVYVDSKTNARDGAIVDADIELNGVNFDLGIDGQTLGTTGCIADLANTLTHELGHLMGLEHTCLAPTDPDRVDNLGHPVPLCSAATDPKITLATMYNYQSCGETTKASVEPDDIAGICAIYPKADDPKTCSRIEDDPGCCGTSRNPGPAALIALGVVGFLARRRRPR